MKKLIYSVIVLCSIFALNAIEPDVSKSTTFQNVFHELESSPVTHLDLKLAKANVFLQSGLENVKNGEYIISPDYSKIICVVNLTPYFHHTISWVDENGSCVYTVNLNFQECELAQRLSNIKNIYPDIKDFAKNHINHHINDENIVLTINATFEQYKDDKIVITHEPIIKWENGEAIYYEGFMKNL